uniref:signal-induced proliferation-associated 1-like protein 1 isoform X1 n=1 Tax=Styela clava TaxID=7725 RepID=UPI00193A41FD|nr:signal-induced proliferation-associated 1-like protein 1 isoform X1 [Styela clava]
MDRPLSKPAQPERTKGSTLLPAKYGAKWLEPAKVNTSRKSNVSTELSQSLPINNKGDDVHRRIVSVYSKRTWPPKPIYKTHKSIDEGRNTNERLYLSGDEDVSLQANRNGETETAKSNPNSQFYEHFQEPSPYRPVISARKAKPTPTPRPKPLIHDSSSIESLKSSGYSSFDIPQPYVKPKPFNKNIRAEITLSNIRPQSENSFFDMVKEHDIKKNNDQRSPASKSVAKVLGHGLDSTNIARPLKQANSDQSFKSNKTDEVQEQCAALKCWSLEKDRPRQSFAHHDWQSMIFSFAEVLLATETLKRKNETTGASKAAAMSARMHSNENTPAGSLEDLQELKLSGSTEDIRTNDVLEWCPFFCNEIGGETEGEMFSSDISQLSTCSQTPAVSVQLLLPENSSHSITNSPTTARMLLINNKGVSVMEKIGIDDDKQLNAVGFVQEYLDGGALYYKKHFFQQDHFNFFGIDDKYGPVAISIKREKLREANANIKDNAWNYRVIVRASELCTLRGSILEDVLISQHYSTTRALKPRDVLEYVCPEINFDCLKSASSTEAVQKQLMKVDEQNVANSYKIGIMYCKKGQTTEEEMYNNEHGSPGFEEFLDLLGDKVQLKGFDKFRGGLDVKTNSTGKESYFTTFQGIEIMFHVTTLLPYTTNNVQQLLRKRHIGNDIVTIVFQEPDSPPFSAQNIRSHFQHLFVVIRVHQPCSSKTSYRIAVTRSQDIPAFGPLIPKDALFPKSETFREFLLTKLLNGERAARSAGKFKAMSMNTRQEYLRDLALNHTSQTGLEASQKFTRFSLTAASRRVIDRDKSKNKLLPEESSLGSLVWHVILQDCTTEGVQCMLGISDYMFLLIRKSTNRVIFSIPCQAIIGWAEFSNHTLHVYFGRGERIAIRASSCSACDWKREVKLRLQTFSIGCETKTKTLRRNARGQLGFHINYEGIVMDVEANGYASHVGVTQGSRLVEICKVLVVTMTHDEMLDLLRTSDVVTVIMILPLEDGTPRRCSKSLYHVSPVLKMIEISSEASYESSGDDNVIHSRSRSDPSTTSRTARHNKSLEDITQVLAQNLSLKLNVQSARDWNHASSASNSAASTPTTNPLNFKHKAKQSSTTEQILPHTRYRPRFYNRGEYEEDKTMPISSNSNHFTTIPLKKSKDKGLFGSGGMKHSTSTESGLNLSSYEYENYEKNNESRTSRPQNFQGAFQSASASNTPATTPTTKVNIFPNRFSMKPASIDNNKQHLLRPKPYRPLQRDPIVSSIPTPNNHIATASQKTRERYPGRTQMLHSTSTESGQDSNTNMADIDGKKSTTTPRRKKHSFPVKSSNNESNYESKQIQDHSSAARHHRRYVGSPQIARRKPKSQIHKKLTRAMSDESICGIVQNTSWRNDDMEMRNHDSAFNSTEPNLADSWDRSTFRPVNSTEDWLQPAADSPSQDEVYHSCASDYSDDGLTMEATADPRSAASISPILPDAGSSEDSYEPISRISTESDADLRLRKIEDALKSLQNQLAREQRSKRRILKEVERLRRDNERLQQQTSTESHNSKRDMTYT